MPLILEVLQWERRDSNCNSRDPSCRRERTWFIAELRYVFIQLLTLFHDIVTDIVVLSDKQHDSLFALSNERSAFLTAWNDLGTKHQAAILMSLGQGENGYQKVV